MVMHVIQTLIRAVIQEQDICAREAALLMEALAEEEPAARMKTVQEAFHVRAEYAVRQTE